MGGLKISEEMSNACPVKVYPVKKINMIEPIVKKINFCLSILSLIDGRLKATYL